MEDLRGRLSALGYLSTPLDRYVLSGVANPGSFARHHAIVSAKVALAAGPLLGLLFALAVVVVHRPRFSRPLDFLALSAWYSLAFGLSVLALEFAAGMALLALVRWRRRGVAAVHATAARAGFAVSLILSAYLALWWRRRAGGSGGIALDLIGLAILALVNGALLRISSLASLAALIRASDLPANRAPRSAGYRLLGLVAVGLLVLGFTLAPRPRAGPMVPSQFETVPVGGRLVVVGWDGIPWAQVSDRRTPGTGAGGDSTRRRDVVVPISREGDQAGLPRPSYWTVIATGRPPSEHGIGDVATRKAPGISAPLAGDLPLGTVLGTLIPGRRVAVSGAGLRAKAVWEILALREGVGVVGWWATWPARAGAPGLPMAVVSDRALLSLDPGSPGDVRVAPQALGDELRRSLGADLARLQAEATSHLGDLTRIPGLQQAALIDGYAADTALRILGNDRIRSVFVYMPGLDILRNASTHSGTAAEGRGASGGPDEEFADYGRFLLDRLAGQLREEDWLVVIGDAGRGPAIPGRDNRGWAWVSGPGIGTGPGDSARPIQEGSWSPLDITPTLLRLRGFPRSLEMPGEARTSFLSPAWRERLVLSDIETYGEGRAPSGPGVGGEGEEGEEEMLERLRSLGYVR